MNPKAMAIVAVAALVAAGAAAIVVFGDGDGKRTADPGDNLDGRLTVFGNANGDDYIDQEDVECVKRIIAGEREPAYFDCHRTYGGATVQRSFADANCDGKIDRADVAWIQDMVDRKPDMLIHFYDVDGVISSCTYPLTTYAVGYKSNYEAELILGNENNCMYVCNQVGQDGPYSPWYRMFLGSDNYVGCFGSRFTPDYEVFSKNAPSYMLSGTRAWFDENMEETVAALGMDVVRLPFWEDNWAIPAIITLGYLTQRESEAYRYAETADSVYGAISGALAGTPVSERVFVYASYNATSISAKHNGMNELVTLAGGRNPLDAGYSPGKIDAETLALTMNPDWIVLDQYFGFLERYEGFDPCKKAIVDQLSNTDMKYVQAIRMTDAYKSGRVIFLQQGVYMGPASYVAAAYIANHINPGLFGFDVDGLFGDYVTRYHPDYSSADFLGLEYFDLARYEEYAS
ncbi:ABC transporter substrate-binding protein [Methanomassiliicoccaceae archaeon COG_1]|nr:ABC transporter substrate-binding protein [Methanomassiliicoccaceae archaeon COG_1]